MQLLPLAILMLSVSASAFVAPAQLHDLIQNPLKYMPTRTEKYSGGAAYTFVQDRENTIRLYLRDGSKDAFLVKLTGKYRNEYLNNIVSDKELLFSDNLLKSFTTKTYKIKSGLFKGAYLKLTQDGAQEETLGEIVGSSYYTVNVSTNSREGDKLGTLFDYLTDKKKFCEEEFIKCFK